MHVQPGPDTMQRPCKPQLVHPGARRIRSHSGRAAQMAGDRTGLLGTSVEAARKLW